MELIDFMENSRVIPRMRRLDPVLPINQVILLKLILYVTEVNHIPPFAMKYHSPNHQIKTYNVNIDTLQHPILNDLFQKI